MTRIVPEASREKMYSFIRQEILKGRQAFVICPLIGEDEENPFSEKGLSLPLPNYDSEEIAKIEIKAVNKESEYLAKKVFPEFKIATLHGKMKGQEKDKIMRDFKEGKSHILVSTSVVEVGVDVPNATIMLIEGAERFGLAQLHQFRGRVGRSSLQSYCFLSLSEGGVTANRRLEALVKTNDGFKLAEADLKLRGPGDFIGIRQSGLPDLTMASLSDGELIKTAKGAADLILAKSADLKEFPELKVRLNAFLKTFHGE
jgi:ATP-dependent DNA helicase RecG